MDSPFSAISENYRVRKKNGQFAIYLWHEEPIGLRKKHAMLHDNWKEIQCSTNSKTAGN
jgi:hypothetical protein